MGLLDDLPDNARLANSKSDEPLNQVQQDLKSFQQDLVTQMMEDIQRLHAEKVELLRVNAELRREQQLLQTRQQEGMSQQQLAQQQLWAKQLAQALANRLYVLLSEKLDAQQHPLLTGDGGAPGAAPSLSALQQQLGLLDQTLDQRLNDLRSDLKVYENSLVQQVNRMESLETRSEAILEELMNQLRQVPVDSPTSVREAPEISFQPAPPGDRSDDCQSQPSPPAPLADSEPISGDPVRFANGAKLQPQQVPAPSPAPAAPFQPSPVAERKILANLSNFQIGLILIMLSTMALSLHNVVVGIIGTESSIFNIWRVGGFIQLGLDSSLLLLWLRMLIVMPLMAAIASSLYPNTWKDIQKFALSRDRRLLINVVGSGFFLFLSQVLIYIAIGRVGPGVAVTILFVYPIVTVPLAWFLFGDRPSRLRWAVVLGIFAGVALTMNIDLGDLTNTSLGGIGTALLSGIAFAFYLISMQLSFRRLHPVPVSVIQFFTIFSLASISLLFRPASIIPSSPGGLVIGGIVLGSLTLVGYLCNNFGVRFMGAARASIIASSGPVLTALLAFLITPGPRTALTPLQVLGILIVTMGVTALALERMFIQRRPPQK
ncbi:MAG: DMT family transporter [Synechococcales bacterium]|nr:DMT family transporter [Synechococcales bacterium]